MSEATYTLDEQIAELRREAGLRHIVYARWVGEGKLSTGQAVVRIGRLRAAIVTLERLRDDERTKINPELFS